MVRKSNCIPVFWEEVLIVEVLSLSWSHEMRFVETVTEPVVIPPVETAPDYGVVVEWRLVREYKRMSRRRWGRVQVSGSSTFSKYTFCKKTFTNVLSTCWRCTYREKMVRGWHFMSVVMYCVSVFCQNFNCWKWTNPSVRTWCFPISTIISGHWAISGRSGSGLEMFRSIKNMVCRGTLRRTFALPI